MSLHWIPGLAENVSVTIVKENTSHPHPTTNWIKISESYCIGTGSKKSLYLLTAIVKT